MENSPYQIIEVKFAQAPQPDYFERRGDGSRVDFGLNNSYPNFLDDLYKESPKHAAIIKGKVNYIYGSGFEGGNARANDFDTWNDVLKKAIQDDEKFGGYALQIVWNRSGGLANVYHIPFKKVRTNYDNSRFWIKDEWDINRDTPLTAKERKQAREYPAFNINEKKGTQILYVKQYGESVYPLPSYVGAINYINADVLIGRHILGMAKDGFVASKLINFNNGDPGVTAKEEIEKAFSKKFTGPNGKKFMLAFNKDIDSAVTVTDLGSTQLTKEDFTNINLLVQQEIYAGHQITSPMLFGIKTEGQLGGRTEMRDAYEIFKNTYVNERQQAHEFTFNKLMNLAGLAGERKIVPVEPIGIEITQDIIASLNLPKQYFLDKLGINLAQYQDAAVVEPGMVNDVLRKMSAKDFQQLQRVVRDYNRGKITRQAAASLLRSGYGLNDEQLVDFLGEEGEFQQFQDESLLYHFSVCGEEREKFVVVKTVDFMEEAFPLQFAEQVELSTLEANVLNLISKDKRITPEVISSVTKKPVDLITEVLAKLKDAGYYSEDAAGEKTLTKPVREITDTKPTTTQILIRYTYEGPKDDRNRPFCAKLLELDKMYSREDIERISARVGYSVWDRRGGWWTQPDGSRSPSCRHQWKTNVVLRKKD